MSRFDPRNDLRGLQRSRLTAAEAEPELFLRGDPGSGFYTSPEPPELGFWGATFHTKRINADLENPGNLLTWTANRVASLTGSERRFVSVGAGSFLGAAAFGESSARSRAEANKVSGWKWLSNRFSPLQDVSQIDAILEFEDEDFDAAEAIQDLQAASPGMVKVLEENGRDVQMFAVAPNREAFQFILSRELMHIQAQQDIKVYNQDAGAFQSISSTIVSGAWNYMLTDPTFAPSLMTGAAGANLAANTAKTGQGIIRIGAGLTRARSAASVAAPIRQAANAVTRVGGAPAAAHAALAGRWGTAAATGIELALVGAVETAATQQERIDSWNEIFGGTEWEQEFSYGEVAIGGLMTGALGFTLAGATRAISNGLAAGRARRGMMEATGSDADNHIARDGLGINAVRAQAAEDLDAVRLQSASERLLGDRQGDLGFLLDRRLMDDAGLRVDDVADMMEGLSTAMGGRQVAPEAAVRLVQDLYSQGAARQGGRQFDSIDRLVMRVARNRAEQRVLRDLPAGQRGNRGPRELVDAILDEEVDLIRRIQRTRPVGLPEEAGANDLRAVVRSLDEAASRRTLTELEEDQLLYAAAALEAVEKLPADARVRLDELSVGSLQRPIQRAQDFTVRDYAPTDALGRAAKDVADSFREMRRLRALVESGEGNTSQLRRALRAASADFAAKSQALQDAAPTPRPVEGPTKAEVKANTAQEGLVESRADRERLFNQQYTAPDAGAGSWLEDLNVVSRALRMSGLGNLASRLATDKTGDFQTVRSAIAGIRQLAELFDHSRFTVEDISPSGTRRFVGNLTDRRRERVRQFAPMADYIDKLVTEGYFGRKGFLGSGRRSKLAEFQEAAYLHAAGLQESTVPEVRELAGMWRKMREQIGEEGLANGTFRDLDDNFVPRRPNIGLVMKDRIGLRTALTDFYTKRWQAREDVHMDTLVTMGWAERVATPGKDVEFRLLGPLAELKPGLVGTLKRAELGDLEPQYAAGLTDAVDDQGFTGLGRSMKRVVDNLTSERTFVEESGRIVVDDATGAVSSFERKLDPEIMADPEIRKFFRTDLVGLAHDYVNHTGLDVSANSLVQQLTGIRGLTFEEYMDFNERQMLRLAKEGTDESKTIRTGMNQLREKFLATTGRERRLIAEAEKVGEFFAETASSGTLAFFGGGVGQAVASTEVFVGTVLRAYNPVQFARQVGLVLQGLNPVTHRATFKEYAGYTSLSIRQWHAVNAQRFTGGSIQSDFHWTALDKAMAPISGLWDTLQGRTAAGPFNPFGRAAVVPQAVEALGRTSFQLGGADYFTRLAWIANLNSLAGETAKFMPAARRLSQLMRDEGDKLTDANRKARQAVLDRGGSERDAIRAGNAAQRKVWQGMTRQAGFGSRWHIAKRFSEHGLLEEGVLDLLEEAGAATGGLKTKGFLPMIDMNRVSRYVNDIDPARAQDMQDAVNRVINSFEDATRRRVAEQSILSRPTNEASRTYHGRMFNTMTSFSRSFFNNVVLDAASMPTRSAAALATAFVVGESLNRMVKRVFNGEDPDDITREFEERPAATMANYALNLPLLGQYNWMMRAVTDPLLTDAKYRTDFTQGASVSVANNILNLTSAAIRAPIDEDARESLGHDGEKMARKLVPGLNSHWGGLFMLGMEEAANVRLRPQNNRFRGRSQDVRYDFNTDALVEGQPGDLLPPSDNLNLDEVLDFMAPLPKE